jgi:hypothetical protein
MLIGGVEVWLYSSLTSSLGGGWVVNAVAALPPEKRPGTHYIGQVWRGAENFAPTGVFFGPSGVFPL